MDEMQLNAPAVALRAELLEQRDAIVQQSMLQNCHFGARGHDRESRTLPTARESAATRPPNFRDAFNRHR